MPMVALAFLRVRSQGRLSAVAAPVAPRATIRLPRTLRAVQARPPMLAREKENQNGNADKRKPHCDDGDRIGPSRQLCFVRRHRREAPDCAGYRAQDGQVADPVGVAAMSATASPTLTRLPARQAVTIR
jgi:hypothetical protein